MEQETMSKVIQILEEMASNAALTNKEQVKAILVDAEITECQKKAIEAKNIDTLTETIHDLPVIKCFPIVVADDEDEAQENTIENKTAINF